LLLDTASLAIGAAALSGSNGSGLAVSGGLFLLGGPIIHGAHGRPGAFFGSLGLRVALPLLGVVVGNGRGGGCDACSFGPEGFLVGAAGAMIVDALLIGYEDVPSPTPLATLRVAPVIGERKGLALAMNF
jgi:hypothetical protein